MGGFLLSRRFSLATVGSSFNAVQDERTICFPSDKLRINGQYTAGIMVYNEEIAEEAAAIPLIDFPPPMPPFQPDEG